MLQNGDCCVHRRLHVKHLLVRISFLTYLYHRLLFKRTVVWELDERKVYWLEVTLTTLYIEASDNTVTAVPVSASNSHTGEGNMLHLRMYCHSLQGSYSLYPLPLETVEDL